MSTDARPRLDRELGQANALTQLRMALPHGRTHHRVWRCRRGGTRTRTDPPVLAQVMSGAVLGVDAFTVKVEADLALGLPAMHVVGLAESAVREGRERVTAALANAGFKLPPRRITFNLQPADVKKDGSAFDLPLAIALLTAMGVVPARTVEGTAFVGELGLDGELRPVRGVLPIAARCAAEGIKAIVVPPQNAAEAAVVKELRVFGASGLPDVLRHLSGERPLARHRSEADAWAPAPGPLHDLDLGDVKGQESAKRALEIAAAGQHSLRMVGPPGAGKSMLARRLPGILPPLDRAEAIEVTRVYSVAGRLRPGQALVHERPFRAPHHSISEAGLIGGGGGLPRVGEISLAHHGVLFLDELTLFSRAVLEGLRQPLEDGLVQIGRARGSVVYPARFMLVAAMNPCPCGFRDSGDARCICTPPQQRQYDARISGPLLDRFDLHIEVPPLPERRLAERNQGEPGQAVRQRVLVARERQVRRLAGCSGAGVTSNSHLGPRELRLYCSLDARGEGLLREATRKLGLSARAYHRVLRLARTIADLEGSDAIRAGHVAEAVQYRTLDRAPRRSDHRSG